VFPAHDRESALLEHVFFHFSTKRSKRRKYFTKMDLLSVGKSSGLTGKMTKGAIRRGEILS
jgi:hypothetical protein